MPEPMPDEPKTDEPHPELLGNQGASASTLTDCGADGARQIEPAPPTANLLADGQAVVSSATEHAGGQVPGDFLVLQCEGSGSTTKIGVQINQTDSLEIQEPRADKPQGMLGGITGDVPEDALAHPALLSYDEPTAKVTVANGMPECTSKPDPVLPSDVGRTEVTETVCTLPAVSILGDSCEIDLPALARPTTDDGNGNSSQAATQPIVATQTLADNTGVAVVPTEVASETVLELSSSTGGTSDRAHPGGSGDSNAQLHVNCAEPEQVPIKISEDSLEIQVPRADKPQGMLGGITSDVPEDALAHPASLSYDEPRANLTADNGIPECASKPGPVLPSDVGRTEATETVCTLPAANSLGDSCPIDLPALARPTMDDSNGNSHQAAAQPTVATQTLADNTRVAVVPTEAASEAVLELASSSTGSTSDRAHAGGSGESNAQPRVNCAEPEQVPIKISTVDACRSVPDGTESMQAEPLPLLSSGDQAQPAVAPAKEDMDILGNGKLVKKVIRSGNGSHTRPQYGSQVTIKYEGQLPNGVVVDEATELSFILHDGDVIAALDLAVALMELGEECLLQTAPDYAYKGIGRHPDIPPDAPMTYTIELLSVSEPPVVSELPVEQIIALADKKRDRGNYLYSRTEYDNAIVCYTRAVQIADDPDIRSEDTHKLQMLLDLRLKCYNNLAATQVKAKQYQAAVESCENVLKIQPLNVKALFRKGKSLGAMGSTKEAIEILKQALKLEPSTKVIHRELYKLQEKLKKDAEDEKSLCKKMMGLKKTASGSGTASGGSQGNGKQQSSRAATYGIVGAVAAVALSIGVFMLRKYL